MSLTARDRGSNGRTDRPQQWQDAAIRRMARIDALPREVRALVHHYGWEPVKIFLDLGVTRPGQLEASIRAVRLMDAGGEDRVLRQGRLP
jgi:hypothetical protein